MIYTLQQLLNREDQYLAPYATRSNNSSRKHPEEVDQHRLPFQLDKDRIIHSKAFRRLDEKTQIFVAGTGDHYRTRLTHSLEVAQISRDIARRLGLNEDLCEVIALAHDLGHPPFGHGGENALNEIMQELGFSFEHNQQSRRVVEFLESPYPFFDGLNLTEETLDGLIKHQTALDKEGNLYETAAHLEAQVVNHSDEIAYINHDIDDGLRSGIISLSELRTFYLWRLAEQEVQRLYGEDLIPRITISRTISTMTALMIDDITKETNRQIEQNNIQSPQDFVKYRGKVVRFSPEMKEMIIELRKSLFNDLFYKQPTIYAQIQEGEEMIKKLFKHYLEHPYRMKKKYLDREDNNLIIAVKDYIAGMTDGFLISEYNKHVSGK